MAEYRLSPSQHLAWIRENLETVLSVPLDQLDAPIVDCPGWRIDSIADHFAGLTVFYEACIRLPATGSPAETAASLSWPESASGQAAIEMCRRNYDDLLPIMEGIDPSAPCAYLTGPGDVATWLWHIAGETWVHRADVEHTLGGTPNLGPDAGVDALEWSRCMRVWFSELNRGEPPPAIRCQTIDIDSTVVMGSGPIVASVSGKACDLALRLWNRQHGPLEGDGGAIQAWADLQFPSG